ncbi:MAG: hypothetical protein AAF828_09210 [Bacteroidota bacterium]
MKKSFLLAALVLGLLPSLFAQDSKLTADEIIDNYIEVIGGEDAWREVKTVQMEGKMSMFGRDIPATITSGDPNKFRIEMDIQGQKVIQSYDGETPWQIMPMMGITTPTKMSEAEASTVTQTEILPEFIDYANRGYSVEMVDPKEVEGVPTQGIKITDGKKKTMVYYFDTENFVPIMMSMTITEGQAKGSVINSYLSDYEEIDGKMVATSTEVKMDGQTFQKLTVEKVTFGIELEEGFFSMPKK